MHVMVLLTKGPSFEHYTLLHYPSTPVLSHFLTVSIIVSIHYPSPDLPLIQNFTGCTIWVLLARNFKNRGECSRVIVNFVPNFLSYLFISSAKFSIEKNMLIDE